MKLIIDLGNYDIKAKVFDRDFNVIHQTKVPTLFKEGGFVLPKFNGKNKNTALKTKNGMLGVGGTFEQITIDGIELVIDALLNHFSIPARSNDIDIYVLVPIGLYPRIYENLESELKISVYPQSYIVDFDGLIVDIGGGTTDFVLKSGDDFDYYSLNKGINNVLAEINSEINKVYDIDTSFAKRREFLVKPFIYKDGTKIDVSHIINSVLNRFETELKKEIKLKSGGSEVYLIGGATNFLEMPYKCNKNEFINVDALKEKIEEEELYNE